MAHYAIGDVHGCYNELRRLIDKIQFDPQTDQLCFVGDLVKRGPNSLSVLRWIKQLGQAAKVVLGNHDLYLIALSLQVFSPQQQAKETSLHAILQAKDQEELISWLRDQPILYYIPQLNYAIVHAGIPPHWSLQQALTYSQLISGQLKSSSCTTLLKNLYFDTCLDSPQQQLLVKTIRWLCFMRYCEQDGTLSVLEPDNYDDKLLPWFKWSTRKTINHAIIFGHWSDLMGKTDTPNVHAIDTGCVLGGQLTALRLEDQQRFSIESNFEVTKLPSN